jgi:pimeloyl-ACP methyl ester carboxylesterase
LTLADDTRGFEHRFIDVNGVKLHVLVGGGGPLVVLLHGWPECWATWRHLLQPLKDAGFTVAAPDLRGFNLSDKPDGVSEYTMAKVSADVVGLIKVLGFQKAHIIAHDWGGAVAWYLAQTRDDVVDKLVIANCPHPDLFRKRLASTPSQLKASYYMFVFQVPVLAEKLLERNGFDALGKMMKYQPKKRGAFDEEDVRVYKEAMGQPGAVTSSLNYYRASFRETFQRNKQRPDGWKNVIERPVLLLWGMNDDALPPENIKGHDAVARDLRVVRIDDCSHWVQHDKPDVMLDESVRFFRA